MELITKRLTLRPIAPEDAAPIWELANDFEVVRHTGTWVWPADRAFTAERCSVGFGDKGGWLSAYDGDQLIGTVGLKHDGDFGYMLARRAWGKGYATEMGQAVIDHAISAPRWTTLKACVFEGNDASARVLEKLGFVGGAACRGRCEALKGEFPIRRFTRNLI